MGDVKQHAEAAIGLARKQAGGKRGVVERNQGKERLAFFIRQAESAVHAQLEAQVFHGGAQFGAADAAARHQMHGDGLVDAGAQFIQRPRHVEEGFHIGEQKRAVHFFGKRIHLLTKLLQLLCGGQAAAAHGLQADHKALVIHARNRLGDLEAVVHGAAGNLKAVAAGKARNGVQLLRFAQRDIGHIIEARVKPRQFELGEIV